MTLNASYARQTPAIRKKNTVGERRKVVVSVPGFVLFAVAEDDAGASAGIERYRVFETGDIGLLMTDFGKSYLT